MMLLSREKQAATNVIWASKTKYFILFGILTTSNFMPSITTSPNKSGLGSDFAFAFTFVFVTVAVGVGAAVAGAIAVAVGAAIAVTAAVSVAAAATTAVGVTIVSVNALADSRSKFTSSSKSYCCVQSSSIWKKKYSPTNEIIVMLMLFSEWIIGYVLRLFHYIKRNFHFSDWHAPVPFSQCPMVFSHHLVEQHCRVLCWIQCVAWLFYNLKCILPIACMTKCVVAHHFG